METYESDSTKVNSNCGKFYIHQLYDENGMHSQVFISGMGKAGNCSSAWAQAIGRLISLVFELGGSYVQIAEQLKDIRCNEPFTDKGQKFASCIDAISAIYQEKRDEADEKARENVS